MLSHFEELLHDPNWCDGGSGHVSWNSIPPPPPPIKLAYVDSTHSSLFFFFFFSFYKLLMRNFLLFINVYMHH